MKNLWKGVSVLGIWVGTAIAFNSFQDIRIFIATCIATVAIAIVD